MDGQRDMTKLRVAFGYFANKPKNRNKYWGGDKSLVRPTS